MDPANPLYRPLRDLYARTVGIVAQLTKILERERGVRYAFVFGSYSRGDDDVRSDIDVFIVGELHGHALLKSLEQLQTDLGREINPVIWSEGDLMARADERAPFLMTVLAEPKIWLLGDEDEFKSRIQRVARPSPRARSRDTSRSGRREGQARSRGAQPRSGSLARRRGP